MKIAVGGLGFVGLSNAILLARHNQVVAVDISESRVNLVNSGKSPVEDSVGEAWLGSGKLDLTATTDSAAAWEGADFVVVATPTDYDPATDRFDTSSVEAVIDSVLSINRNAGIIIRSTIPIGFVDQLRERTGYRNIMFAPEFLREGRAVEDNLNPSRIVLGDDSPAAHRFVELLLEGADTKTCPVLFTGAVEAEAIKLFANTYLAMRVAFFNELDSYAMTHGLNTRNIVDGIGFDPRIGTHYNNPSFGYGGYCLPKDSKQLLSNYGDVPQNLIAAVVEANRTRKDLIAEHILARKPKIVGVFRLAAKEGSANFRQASILDVMALLKNSGVELLIYEPLLDAGEYAGGRVVKSLEQFKAASDIIVANRQSPDLESVAAKVFTRDIYGRD